MGWAILKDSQYMINGKTYKDPIQGTTPSCGFIAGIASQAWVNPALIPNSYQGIKNNMRWYQFKFYPAPGPSYGIVNASEKVASEGARSSDLNELWPSLYEKAYAGWVLADRPKNKTIDVDEPNLSNVAWANSEMIMEHITGKDYSTKIIKDYKANEIWGLLNGLQPMSKSMIAWTYADKPLIGDYDDNIIKKDHAYSVLGCHPTNLNYVLLRNPYGPSKGDPADATITLNVGSVTLPNKPIIYLTTTSDGVFALNVATFQTHFMKIAYTAG